MRRLCAFGEWRGMLGELPPSTKPMERYGRVALSILVAIEIPEYHSGKWI